MPNNFIKKLTSQGFVLKLVSFSVFADGLLIVYSNLLIHLIVRTDGVRVTTLLSISLVIGISLIYLSMLLNRRKHLAWVITLAAYSVLFAINIFALIHRSIPLDIDSIRIVRSLIIPGIIVFGLLYNRKEFKAKSDIQSFKFSLRSISIILLVAFFYGVIGMQLLDVRDFHQQISLVQSVHYTLDQFGLTTNQQLTPYTGRASLFLFTLSLVSAVSLFYVFVSLFQPLKAKFRDQSHQREHMMSVLEKYGGSSEDFFKIWPKDKSYLFASGVDCGLAFRVEKGIVLCVGDPAGNTKDAPSVLTNLEELCLTNDWLPAFIHTEPKWNNFYTSNKFKLQKIGEEAIVDLNTFTSTTAKNKYFRNIKNKFNRMNYRTEQLLPPHSETTLKRLKEISNQWLSLPGREERGMMMGYFDYEYIQSCSIFVALDQDNQIQCFLNQVHSYDKSEANYDLLRYAQDAPGNINDYLLIKFAHNVQAEGFKTLNLGLAPLAGIDDDETENNTVIQGAVKLVYSQGDRFYSFKGLYRFKQKYEPKWQSRYIAYKGGLRGFSRTINALNHGMSHSVKHKS